MLFRSPAGCQNDQVVKSKGNGMPKFRGGSRGDLYAHISVAIPKKLTKKQRDLMEKLAADMGESVSPQRPKWQKLREAFE